MTRARLVMSAVAGVAAVAALLLGLPGPQARAATPASAIGNNVILSGVGADAAVDDARGVAYVSIPSLDEILVITLDDPHVSRRLAVEGGPRALTISLDGTTLYAGLTRRAAMAAIDLRTHDVSVYDVRAALGTSAVFDMVQPRADEVWLSGDIDSFSYLVRLTLSTGVATRMADGRSLLDWPPLASTGDHVFVRHSSEVSKVEVTSGQVVLNSGFNTASGRRLVLSPDGQWIVTSQGQEFATASLTSAGTFTPGFPLYNGSGTQLAVLTPQSHAAYAAARIEVFEALTNEPLQSVTTNCRAIGAQSAFEGRADDAGFVIVSGDNACVTGPIGPPVMCGELPATIFGSPRDDVLYGTSGVDRIAGLAGDDVIHGGFENDVLCGDEGDDQLLPGRGDDLIMGGEGGDTLSYIYSGAAVDVQLPRGTATGDGLDTIQGVESVIGSRWNDVLSGNADHTSLNGHDGDDVVHSSGGPGLLDGGSGHDLASFAASMSPVTVDLESGTVAGDWVARIVGFEQLTGSPGDDVLAGTSAWEVIDGGPGNDMIDGRGGDDELIGGGGENLLHGGEGRDTVTYKDSPAAVVVDLSIGSASGWGTDGLTGIENIIGSDLADHLNGDGAANVVWGGGGDDRILTFGGSDTAAGGDGADEVDAGSGDDAVFGDAGDDTLLGGTGYDTADGGSDVNRCSAEISRNC